MSQKPIEQLENLPELGDIAERPEVFLGCTQILRETAYNINMLLIGYDKKDELNLRRLLAELSRHMDEAMLWITSAERAKIDAEIEEFNKVVPLETQTEGANNGEDNTQ